MAGLSGSPGEMWDEGPGILYQPEHFISGLHCKAQEGSWLKGRGGWPILHPSPQARNGRREWEGSGSSGRHRELESGTCSLRMLGGSGGTGSKHANYFPTTG